MSETPMQSRLAMMSSSEQETERLGEALAHRLLGGEAILLHGELGAGKTCFVRGLAKGFGLDPHEVSSPTYVICHEYQRTVMPAAKTDLILIHVDGYRLRDSDDLETIGWSSILDMQRRQHSVLAIEWPERLGRAVEELPLRIDVVIEHVDEHRRGVTISGQGEAASIVALLSEERGGVAVYKCRRCGAAIDPRVSENLPFCSERCRLSDLGKWMREEYRTSRHAEADEELNE